MLPFFPVEKGKEARTQSFVRMAVSKIFSQLSESETGEKRR